MPENKSDKEVDVELSYGKLGAKLFRVNSTAFMATFAVIVCLWFGWIQFKNANAADSKEHQDMIAEIKNTSTRMEEGQKKTQESIREMTYVLTLSQKDREKLKLDMPDSLKRRTYGIDKEGRDK